MLILRVEIGLWQRQNGSIDKKIGFFLKDLKNWIGYESTGDW